VAVRTKAEDSRSQSPRRGRVDNHQVETKKSGLAVITLQVLIIFVEPTQAACGYLFLIIQVKLFKINNLI
jgi:hypothetical protein